MSDGRQGDDSSAPPETPVIMQSQHLSAVLALNEESEIETSALDFASLQVLVAQSFWATVIDGGRQACLIALDQDADYTSPNFRWFQAHFDRFVYVDRVITAASARGQGHGRRLYEDLFAAVASAGHRRIAAEVNLDPPNPASDAFHARLGFAEVGRAKLSSGKTVRYLVCETAKLPR